MHLSFNIDLRLGGGQMGRGSGTRAVLSTISGRRAGVLRLGVELN